VELEQVAQRLKGRLVRAWPLEGGVSARTTAIEVGQRAYVVREHAHAALEFRLLQLLADTGIPVPPPRLLDEAGAYLVTDYVESDPLPPAAEVARALAAALVEIHRLETKELSFLPTLDEPGALLHGDLWPGNVLWRDGRLAAIVDWEDAAIGDPLRDLAVARLELLWAYGREEMDELTEQYRRACPSLDFAALPERDLEAAERLAPQLPSWGLDPDAETRMRERSEDFAADARQRLRGC
jgi:aminoglycoside phosphotransferase (APT) family kinase protein